MKKYRIVKNSRISTYPDGRKEETDVYYAVEKRAASTLFSLLFDPVWLPIKVFYSSDAFDAFNEAKEYVDAEVLKSAVKTKDMEKIVYER